MAKQNKSGRPRIEFTSKQIQEVEKMSSHLTCEQMAEYFGISHTAFQDVRSRQPEVLLAYKKGRAEKIIRYSQLLDSKADGTNPEVDATSTIFFLKTQAGWSTDSSIKLKANIPEDASPLDILNIITRKLSNEGLTPTEFKQLTDLVQLKQQVLSLQPKDELAAPLHTLDECIEIANKLLPASNILELELENRRLKKQLAEAGNA